MKTLLTVELINRLKIAWTNNILYQEKLFQKKIGENLWILGENGVYSRIPTHPGKPGK